MKKLCLMLTFALLLSAFTGCNTQTPPVDSDATAADSTTPEEITARLETTTAESDTTETPDTTLAEPVEIEPNGDFELFWGDPVVVAHGEPGNFKWGYMQFPMLYRTEEGYIVGTWEEGSDDIYYKATVGKKITTDGGVTWTDLGDHPAGAVDDPMPNGKYFAGFIRFGSHEVNYFDKYTPGVDYGNDKLYFWEDLKDDPSARQDTEVWAQEYDPVTGETTDFQCTIHWPYAVLKRIGNLVYPYQMMFALQNRSVITVGDDLYLPMYFTGFDSYADSREDAVMDLSHKYSVYVFKSTDSGRTWDLLSQVYTTAEHTPNYAEGVCEPEMTVMPDGSFVMLMRTGSNNPSYMVRSTDGGYTWSDPVQFDRIGVMPQILTLECGVTIATYGRPTMRMCATSDPSGLTWRSPEDVVLLGGSCYYTDLIAIDEDTALWIYADDGYKDENGQRVKAIVARTITVVPK